MRIVWDETKRQRNLAKHKMDFANLTADFFEIAMIVTGRDGRLDATCEPQGEEIDMNQKFAADRLLTDAEEAEIQSLIASDPDNPELTDEEMATARPFAEVFPELTASIRKTRGPNKMPTKTLVSLRLSGDVIDKYKQGGPGWQSRIDDDLRRLNKIK